MFFFLLFLFQKPKKNVCWPPSLCLRWKKGVPNEKWQVTTLLSRAPTLMIILVPYKSLKHSSLVGPHFLVILEGQSKAISLIAHFSFLFFLLGTLISVSDYDNWTTQFNLKLGKWKAHVSVKLNFSSVITNYK